MGSSDAAVFAARATARAKRRPDVISHIKADYRRIRLLTDALRLSQGAAAAAREPLIDRLSDALDAHSAAADQCFYGELMARGGDERRARRAVEVFDAAALLIDELSMMEDGDEAWQETVGQLSALLDQHFKQEEEETLPLAKTLLGSERAARLGERYDAAKRRWIEAFGRLPAAPVTPPAQPQPVKPAIAAEPAAKRAGSLAGRQPGARVRSHVPA